MESNFPKRALMSRRGSAKGPTRASILEVSHLGTILATTTANYGVRRSTPEASIQNRMRQRQ